MEKKGKWKATSPFLIFLVYIRENTFALPNCTYLLVKAYKLWFFCFFNYECVFLGVLICTYNVHGVHSEVRIEGLETLDYLDNLCQKERFTEQGDAITFESEVNFL